MNTKSLALPVVVLPLLLSLTLAACASPAPTVTSDPPVVPAQASPAPIATPNALDNDETLLISATATAANGAQLSLQTQVHLAIPFDDVAGQTLPQAMVDDCGADLTMNILRAQAWSFTRVNTSAIPVEGSSAGWPADARIDVRPSTQFVSIAGRGIFQSDPNSGSEACHQEKFFGGTGNGGLAVGIPGDTVDDASRFTRWSAHSYGYVALAGVTLTGCTFQLTDLGKQYGAESANWSSQIDAGTCVIGPASEVSSF